jgi:hypothetical protein
MVAPRACYPEVIASVALVGRAENKLSVQAHPMVWEGVIAMGVLVLEIVVWL